MVSHPVSKLAAGLLAIAFVSLIQHGARRARRSPSGVAGATALAVAMVLSVVMGSQVARAADVIAEGTVVRAEFTQAEPGWHEGTLRRAQDRCWMVFLGRRTQDGYVLIALTATNRLQISRGGQWVDAPFAANLNAQPAACREEGSD